MKIYIIINDIYKIYKARKGQIASYICFALIMLVGSIVYEEIIKANDILLASPMYMSNINGILKNLIDRFIPLYNHELLKGKKFYLILTGYATKEANEEEINGIIEYFKGISEWLYIEFEFLDYFKDSNDQDNKDKKIEQIKIIKEKLNR